MIRTVILTEVDLVHPVVVLVIVRAPELYIIQVTQSNSLDVICHIVYVMILPKMIRWESFK